MMCAEHLVGLVCGFFLPPLGGACVWPRITVSLQDQVQLCFRKEERVLAAPHEGHFLEVAPTIAVSTSFPELSHTLTSHLWLSLSGQPHAPLRIPLRGRREKQVQVGHWRASLQLFTHECVTLHASRREDFLPLWAFIHTQVRWHVDLGFSWQMSY